MNWKLDRCTAFSLNLALGIASFCGFGEAEESKPPRPKMIFTNDDLQRYRDEVQAGSTGDVPTTEKKKINHEATTSLNSEGSGEKPKSYWAERLKEADRNLNQVRSEEKRFSESLADFQKKLSEAKTDFQKKTAQWQIEDTEKNLGRSTAERKKAEEKKANVLAEAAKKGFKMEDLEKEKLLTNTSR